MSECPCGSRLQYSECCEPVIKGEKVAQTAEELMRSRYSAYVMKEIDYIYKSTHPGKRDDYDEKSTRNWAEKSKWEGLDIISTEKGGADDTTGKVEFIARFTYRNNKQYHHESADFVKEDGIWYFSEGSLVPQKPVVRQSPKIGRNDPCPCGSGKKFKKCCGKEA